MKKPGKSDRGDVLMEYVLITVLIIVPIVAGSKIFFSADGSSGTTASAAMALENPGDFGIVGNDFVGMCRRVFSGLALPVP